MKQDSINYRSFQDLSRTIRKNIYLLDTDFDLIVGIPRSGIIPAYMIALFLNKRVCSLDEFLNKNLPNNGLRPISDNGNISKVLIVDDSINTGSGMKIVKEKVRQANFSETDIKYLAIYHKGETSLVDYFFEYVPTPRIFQWNYLNISWNSLCCFDIDGVLCVDPTDLENDDGENYKRFLLNAKPLYIPKYKIHSLVTSRLEKYRSETEEWLKKNGVQYDSLFMLDLPSQEERKRRKIHAEYKAKVYSQLVETILFVESDEKQARKIADISGKPCICVETDEIFYTTENKREIPISQLYKKDLSHIDFLENYNKIYVSVIMPVYNVEQYLQEALDSVRQQSLKEIEIICVDDGSTDNSLEILYENAKKDKRIHVFSQQNQFAGVARNTGLAKARGEYVIFLDPDDLFDPYLLEKVYTKVKQENSDVCIFDAWHYNESNQRCSTVQHILKKEYLPFKQVFSYKDIPDYIFNITSGAPWNKMFKLEFIKSKNILFQPIKNTNDFYFVAIALVQAKKITILDEKLIFYRVGVNSSLQATRDEAPLEFSKAFLGVKEKLTSLGIYDDVRKSFANRALTSSLYNLNTLNTAEAYEKVYNSLKFNLFLEFDIANQNEEYFYNKNDFKKAKRILDLDVTTSLFNDYKWECKQNKHIRKNRTKSSLENELNMLYSSKSYKIGRAITYLPRKFRGLLKCYNENGFRYTFFHAVEKFKKFVIDKC